MYQWKQIHYVSINNYVCTQAYYINLYKFVLCIYKIKNTTIIIFIIDICTLLLSCKWWATLDGNYKFM